MSRRSTNKAGIELIKEFEGFRNRAYRCPAGVLTIGYGHTGGVKETDTITIEEAEELLKRDLLAAETFVESAVRVSINDNQFSALVSFVYNLGNGSLMKSTLLKKLNVGDIAGAASEFGRWTKVNGEQMLGLVRRRNAEMNLFLSM